MSSLFPPMPEGRYSARSIEKIKEDLWQHERANVDIHMYRFGLIEEIGELTRIACDHGTSIEDFQQIVRELGQLTRRFRDKQNSHDTA